MTDGPTLQERINTEVLANVPPAFTEMVDRMIDDLRVGGVTPGIDVGAAAPRFAAPDVRGTLVRPDDRLAAGPVVLCFYRGAWCPICNLELRALQGILPEIQAAGASLVAVNPQRPDDSLTLVESLGLAMTPEEFVAARDARTEALFRACVPMPGAVALTQYLARHGIPRAIGTSSSRRTLAFKTAAHGEWLASFGAIVSADDVEHGKPAPDIFLRAAALIGAPPESTLVFEDAPSGVEAALAAGMHVVAVPEHAFRDRVGAAHLVLSSLEAFDPAPWGLPAF